MRELPEVLDEAYKVLDYNEYCYPEKVILGLQEAIKNLELDETSGRVESISLFGESVWIWVVEEIVEVYEKALKLQGLIVELLQLGIREEEK